jgi:hypothetical protein
MTLTGFNDPDMYQSEFSTGVPDRFPGKIITTQGEQGTRDRFNPVTTGYVRRIQTRLFGHEENLVVEV